MPSPLANLGAGLRLLRGVRPQLEVARAAGVDPGTLNKIENGKGKLTRFTIELRDLPRLERAAVGQSFTALAMAIARRAKPRSS